MKQEDVEREINDLIKNNRIPDLKIYLFNNDPKIRKFAVDLMSGNQFGYVSQFLCDLMGDVDEGVRDSVYKVTWAREKESNCKYILKKLKNEIEYGSNDNMLGPKKAEQSVKMLMQYAPDQNAADGILDHINEMDLAYILDGDETKNIEEPFQAQTKQDVNIMKCPYCSHEISENAIVCSHCGRAVMSTKYVNPITELKIDNEVQVKVQKISKLLMINGIVNIIWGFGVSIISAGVCIPLYVFSLVLGIAEISNSKQLKSTSPVIKRSPKLLAKLEIANIVNLNPVSLIIGITNLNLCNDPTVENYFNTLIATQKK